MDRPASRLSMTALVPLVLAASTLTFSTGCHPGLLVASAMYMWQGGNLVPAACEVPLEEKRVVVFCRPPASQEFRHAGASRQIAKLVTSLIRDNGDKIDMVSQRKVDEWIDMNDSNDFEELGQAVKADFVIYIDLAHFELYKGKTVYQGNADVSLTVYDMNDNARDVWDLELGEVLYPVHSGIAVQDKRVDQFQREYVKVVADQIARNFYAHDPNDNFAMDALANQ